MLSEDDGTNIPNTVNEDEYEVQEDDNIDSLENEDQEDQEDEEDQVEEKIPLRVYLELKKKHKEAKKKLREHQEKELDSEVKEFRDEVYQEWIDKGYEPDMAETLANQLVKIKNDFIGTKKKSLEDSIDEEIKDLSESDDFFNDAEEYTNEIKKKIREYKKQGVKLSAEQAYLQVVNVKTKVKEYKTKQEQLIANSKSKGKSKQAIVSQPSSKSKSHRLSDDEKKTLNLLRQNQPDAGWTEEKYIKLMKS
jgi:hypothetical protein